MKIIATVDSENYLIQASKREIALLHGFKNEYDDGFSKANLKPGLELDLQKIAKTSEFILTVDKSKLQNLKNVLSQTVDDLDQAIEQVRALTLFETLKEDPK